jgi:NAD(P)-dependent dehydrogenase (short-subunit alcohol dehydrogenase family)
MPVYVVTGTNRGLGLEFVRQLTQSPSNTILAAVRSLSSDLGDLRAVASPTTHILECDTASLASIHSFTKAAAHILNPSNLKIDFLLNSAAINPASWQSSLTLVPDDLTAQINTNVLGPAKTVEFLLEQNLLSENVKILSMTSGLGSLKISGEIKPRKAAGYSISKAALNMLAIHQAEDLKEKLPGVVVIVMDPGWVKTRMGGKGAVLEPEESISGMLKVLGELKESDNGKFFHHSGEERPW